MIVSALAKIIEAFEVAGYTLTGVEGADKGELFVFEGKRPSIEKCAVILNEEACMMQEMNEGIFLRIYGDDY